ncbi:MAG TPA: anti-sigma factor [Pyrinomonadaceae bacterium]|nr:anti-sigma factor [Pyrinomonadaceae bacterium]
MAHEEYKEALALDALDALDEEGRRTLGAHLASCAECRAELRELRDAASALAYTVAPVAPPPELRARIFERVHALASESSDGKTDGRVNSKQADVLAMPDPSTRVRAAATTRRPAWVAYGAIAASLVIAALGVALLVLWRQNQEMRAQVARLAQSSSEVTAELERQRAELAREREMREVLTAPDSRVAELAGTKMAEGASARFALDRASGRAMLVAYNLPPAPAGKAYQLWFIKDGKKMPGGVFKTDERGRAAMSEQVPVEGRDASVFAVTLESEHGEVAPKGEIYLAGPAS